MGRLLGMSLEGSRIQQREKSSCDGVLREPATVTLWAILKMDVPSEVSRAGYLYLCSNQECDMTLWK